MKKVKTTNRMPLKVGATITLSFILIAFMCVAAHFRMNTRSKADIKGDDVCTTTTITSTGTTSTTSSTTTSTTTKKLTTSTQQTTSTTTTQETTSQMTVVVTEPATEPVTEPPAPEPQPEPQPAPDPEPQPEGEIGSAEVICNYSENDAVLLAQLINKEASATWEGKIAVGNCVINRANVNGISIRDVIFAKNQFTTASSLGDYTAIDYQAAVQVLTYGSSDTRIYFFDGNHPDCKNWFYSVNHEYLGAW